MIRYFYFCLTEKPDLCVGVSPGNSPNDHAMEGMGIQLKSYRKNKDKGSDGKKMRWFLNDETGLLHLQDENPFAAPLCASIDPIDYPLDVVVNTQLRLFNCSTVAETQRWTLSSENRLTMKVNAVPQCMVAYDCSQKDNKDFCNPTKRLAQKFPSEVIRGSYLGLTRCYDKDRGDTLHLKYSQSFFQDFNCTADCTPEMQENRVCDLSCDNPICEQDLNSCVTFSPTQSPIHGTTSSPLSTNSVSTFSPTLARENNEEGGGGGLYTGFVILLLIVLVVGFCCCRRRWRWNKRRVRSSELEEDTDYTPIRAMASEDEVRFQTSNAVALNQLRYHSKPASSSVVPTTTTTEPQESSGNFKLEKQSAPFEEVGLV